MKKLTAILLSSVLVASLTACSGSAGNETSAPATTTVAPTTTVAETTTAAETKAPQTGIADGTYEGEGTGKGGTIKVELTIKNSEIADIVVVEHQETPGYAAPSR